MKTITSENSHFHTFTSLKPGDGFVYGGNTYIKIKPREVWGRVNAIKVANGNEAVCESAWFSEIDTVVDPRNVTFESNKV